MGQWRGFGVVIKYVSKFLSEHGIRHHVGAWIEIPDPTFPQANIHIGHWAFAKPSFKSGKKIGYLFTEGKVKREGIRWMRNFDYIIAPSRWVKDRIEEIGLHVDEIIPVGIDTRLFKPMNLPKFVDVLSIGIWESEFDNRKFMQKVGQKRGQTVSMADLNWMEFDGIHYNEDANEYHAKVSLKKEIRKGFTFRGKHVVLDNTMLNHWSQYLSIGMR